MSRPSLPRLSEFYSPLRFVLGIRVSNCSLTERVGDYGEPINTPYMALEKLREPHGNHYVFHSARTQGSRTERRHGARDIDFAAGRKRWL